MEHQLHYQRTISKDNILDVIQRVELQPNLQILEKKKLPSHLWFVEGTCVTIEASFTSYAKYSDNRPNTVSRPSFINKPPSSDRRNQTFSNDRKANTSLPSGTDRSQSRTPNSQQQRNTSRSPGRPLSLSALTNRTSDQRTRSQSSGPGISALPKRPKSNSRPGSKSQSRSGSHNTCTFESAVRGTKTATRRLKDKFRYPGVDSAPNSYKDNRNELEKIQSILRTTSQILDKEQT